MLRIEGLRKHYAGEAAPALDGVNLEVREGEFVAVLGRSGAGKSTLIRCINRLVEPDEGRISWKKAPITGIGRAELRRMRGRIGMIFQHYDLLPRLDVMTNVIVGRFAEMPLWRSLLFQFTDKHRSDAREALVRVGLGSMAHKSVSALSGGQQQRVAIARVLMQRPELLLGDEPVSSLDPVTAERVMQLLQSLHREEGLTLLLNLHDVGLAKAYATRIVGLAGGSVVFDGPPEQLDDSAMQRIYPPDND
ncbi:phosphonate ABC transporter ATP-binding protein [Paenibacillus chartarius]|uniref:Phosphonate ABC transporter ATP-binding protein n=1 Tax=Paenibacillus chartarius TaxID=747481 RepID=A0ABV6DI69_9BACL